MGHNPEEYMAEAPDDDLLEEGEDTVASGEDTQPATDDAPGFDVEGVARLAGWSPLENWRGDPADWKDASAFLVETAAVNKTLRKDVKELRQGYERVTKVAERIVQSERERAIETARAELKLAVQAGDEEAADQAAQKLTQASTTDNKAQASSADEFAAQHAWFGVHAEATGLAQVAAEKAFRAGKDTQAQFAAAEQAVRARFAYLFDDEPQVQTEQRQPLRQQPVVQGGQRTPRTGPRDPVASLTAEERKAGEAFVRITKGRMTLADYAKSLREENA